MAIYSDALQVLERFISEVNTWKDTNAPQEVKQYKELKSKDTMGSVYRNDQAYYEKLSSFKSKYYSFRGVFLKIKSENNDRILARHIDSSIEQIDEQIKLLDSEMIVVRSRLKFYENIIFMVSNLSYGDF